MNELEKIKKEFIGKKFTGFSWEGDLDHVSYVNTMDEYDGKIIEITECSELFHSGYYSVTGVLESCLYVSYYYPLEQVRKRLLIKKNEEELVNHIFSLIKKATI
jgi:hypothetical protein